MRRLLTYIKPLPGKLVLFCLSAWIGVSALLNASKDTKKLGIVLFHREKVTIILLTAVLLLLLVIFAAVDLRRIRRKQTGLKKKEKQKEAEEDKENQKQDQEGKQDNKADKIRAVLPLVRCCIVWLLTPIVIYCFVQWVAVYKSYSLEVLPEYVFKNLIVYYILLLILTLLFRKLRTAQAVFSLAAALLSLVFYFVFEFRGRPASIVDLTAIGTAADVAGGYKIVIDGALGRTLLLYMIAAVILVNLQTGEFRRKRAILAARILLSAILTAGCVIFIYHAVDSVYLIGAGDFWRLNDTYKTKGVAYTLIGQTRYLQIEKPDEYSPSKAEKTVLSAAGDYDKKRAGNSNSAGTRDDSDAVQSPENLIVIMNESFADMDVLGEVRSSAPLIPEWKKLSEEYSSGKLHVQIFGGGTSDTEYEVLTGNTKLFFPQNGIIFESFCREPEYGMVDLLKEQGFYTIGMHPAKGSNWNRERAYEEMGFDETIFLDDWEEKYRKKIRGFISDEGLYEYMIGLCNEKEPGEKLFLFGVTMQNHGAYDNFDAFGLSPELDLEYEADYSSAAFYLSLLNESSRAFKKLTEEFADSEQRTMIVMFGDHQANIPGTFYNELIGKDVNSLDDVELNRRYMVPYLIWTNYQLPRKTEDMSSNYFGCYIMEEAGLALSPYQKFLLTVKDKLPVLGMNNTYKDTDGNWYTADTLPDQYGKLLEDYRTVQYNRTADRGHMVEKLFNLESAVSGEE